MAKAKTAPLVTVRTHVTNPISRKGQELVLAHTDRVEQYLADGLLELIETEAEPASGEPDGQPD